MLKNMVSADFCVLSGLLVRSQKKIPYLEYFPRFPQSAGFTLLYLLKKEVNYQHQAS